MNFAYEYTHQNLTKKPKIIIVKNDLRRVHHSPDRIGCCRTRREQRRYIICPVVPFSWRACSWIYDRLCYTMIPLMLLMMKRRARPETFFTYPQVFSKNKMRFDENISLSCDVGIWECYLIAVSQLTSPKP